MAPPDEPTNPVLSVVVPTYNERENIVRLATDILEAVADTPVEVIVVDDNSPDGTAAAVAELAATDARVRIISRDRKQGLSGAVFEGVAGSSGAYICVMDADFSHDPEEIPQMLAKAQAGYDVVVGSRYAKGAAFVGQPLTRRVISYALNLGARLLLQIGTHDVLTGYALVRRDVLAITPTRFSASGFKWLVEVLATQRGLRVCEWPILFRDREAGASKATYKEAATFAVLCARLFAWRVRHVGGRR
jgi:dolichol-phosphate mannosyltransferase